MPNRLAGESSPYLLQHVDNPVDWLPWGDEAFARAEAEGKPYSSGSYEDVKSGKCPLNRFLYLYVNQAPGKPTDPLVREFLKLIFSKESQEVVLKDGYLPLPADIVKKELAKLR